VGAEFLGHAFVDPQQLLDEKRHFFALDLMDQQAGGAGAAFGGRSREARGAPSRRLALGLGRWKP
jgi:hypothetical protein